MIRRATILVLATVVSLCATQPAPVRVARSQEIPAITWLAESHSEKALKLKVGRPQYASDSPTLHFAGQSLDAPQSFSAAVASRAPPTPPV